MLPLLSISEAIDKIELTGASGLGQMRQEPGLIQRRDKLCMAREECNPPDTVGSVGGESAAGRGLF